ncbi:hypothetical protein [Alicyclobacillus ferrooxydans]|uniref:Uncharacterized protein n=1 Tax=Alicyclobacillus ferrooxydans TaxID=471514 RepID=A0A0P9GRQ3_9BACL|nr:hypothetical protein [Alicyclobacillus ferrooxydans]KPV43688.1 hypothetical protein AN477_10995 [Alicyclobacillus ferrooxydans]
MKNSHRTPGYSYRRSGITDLKASTEANMEQYDVHGDALNGAPDRIPNKEDAKRAGDFPKRSPLG